MVDHSQNPFSSTLDTNPFEDPKDLRKDDDIQLRARERELNEREQNLQRQQEDLNAKIERFRKVGNKNWPPCFPLIFHSIADEIPEASRPLITRLYQLWLVLFVTLVVNMVACIFVLLSGSPDGGRDLGGSIGYLIIIPLASFLLWYRPIYNGYMKEQSLYYYLYFLFGGFHLLFSIYMVIGVPSTGSAGLIQTIQSYARKAIVAGVLGTVATVGWVVQGLGNAFYFRQIWGHHNAAGHSMEKAKSELASHGAKAYFTRG